MLKREARLALFDSRWITGLAVVFCLTLASVASAANQVTSISRLRPSTVGASRIARTGETSGTAVWRVAFSGPVTYVSVDDFRLYAEGSATGRIASVATADATGAVYLVTVDQLGGVGLLRLELRTGTNIRCADDNVNPPPEFTSGEVYALGAQVYSFGYNYYWQLGNYPTASTTVSQFSPVIVEGGTEGFSGKAVVAITATNRRSFAVTEQGEVYGWGENGGLLGTNDTLAAKNARLVKGLTGNRIVHVSAHSQHALALSDVGSVFAWGKNASGRLGNNSTVDAKQAIAVEALAAETIVAVAAGYDHSLALTAEGRVYSWGENNCGQLGTNSLTDSYVPVLVYGHDGVHPDGRLFAKRVVAIAAGLRCSFVVTEDGAVYGWGYNYQYQLGNGVNSGNTLTPQPVLKDPAGTEVLGDVATVAASETYDNGSVYGYFTLALGREGIPYAWGDYSSDGNRLATGDTADVRYAKGMLPLDIRPIDRISAGGFHSLAVDSNHVAYACGRGTYGSLGTGNSNHAVQLTPINASGVLAGKRVVDASAGGLHSLVLAVGVEPPLSVDAMEVPAPGNYVAVGSKLTFKTTYSGDVSVSTTGGTPCIPLVIGTTTRKALYVADQSTIRTLVFEYEIHADDADTDGVQYLAPGAPQIQLDGGAIRDANNGDPVNCALTAALKDVYVVPPPQISAVSPISSPLEGGVEVTILGKQFDGVTAVRFGGEPGEIVPGSVTATSLRVVVPEGAGYGAVDVVVGKPGAESASVPGDTRNDFTYAAAPDVISVKRHEPKPPVIVAGATVTWLVTFSTLVDGVDASDFDLQKVGVIGGEIQDVVAVGGAGKRHEYLVTVQATGQAGTLKLLVKRNGSIKDAAEQPMVASDTSFESGQIYAMGARAYSFGQNLEGELGIGSSLTNKSAVAVLGGEEGFGGQSIVEIAAGFRRSFAVTAGGEVYGWGKGMSNLPKKIPFPDTVRIVRVSADYAHALALTDDGRVYAWGKNGSGELGDGLTTDRAEPKPILGHGDDTSVGIAGKRVIAIAAGFNHSLALTEDGLVYAWGNNASRQLGDGRTANRGIPAPIYGHNAGQEDGVLHDKRAIAIAAGYIGSYAVSEEGRVYAWGANAKGQLGNGTATTAVSDRPIEVEIAAGAPLTGIVGICAGRTYYSSGYYGNNTYAMAGDGTLYAWGSNSDDQSVTGYTNSYLLRPVLMQKGALGAQRVIGLSSSAWHAIALGEDGHAYTGGRGKLSILGSDDDAVRMAFGGIDETGVLSGKEVVSVAAGGVHSLVLAVRTAAPLSITAMEVPAPGNYVGAGSKLTFKTTYSGDVSVGTTGGTPYIPLVIGTSTRRALFVPDQSTIRTLVFEYEVQANDADADGVRYFDPGAPEIVLDGGAIQEAGNGDPVGLALTAAMEDVYIVSPPQISEVSPIGGPLEGGIEVAIMGRMLEGVTSVRFGDRPAPIVPGSVTATSVHVIVPQATEYGTVEVVVGKPGVESVSTPGYTGDDFTYAAAPDVVSVKRYEPQVPVIGAGASATWLVTFSTLVDGVDITDFDLQTAGLLTGTIQDVVPVGGAGKRHEYLVTVSTAGRAGTLRLLVKRDGSISDTAEQPMVIGESFATGQVYAMGAKAYAFGQNTKGELGIGVLGGTRNNAVAVLGGEDGFGGQSLVAIAAAFQRSFAVTAGGEVYGWGKGMATLPRRISFPDAVRIVRVSADYAHALALTDDGRVYAWGENGSGELGDGLTTDRAEPRPILGHNSDDSVGIAGRRVVAIAAGYNHSVALTEDGLVYSWGNNTSRQLGDGLTASRGVPMPIYGQNAAQLDGVLYGKRVVAIAAGYKGSYAVTEEGRVYAWGVNAKGQLGNGTATTTVSDRPIEVEIAAGAPLTGIVGICAGRTYYSSGYYGNNTYAMAGDGTLYAWGSNSDDQSVTGYTNSYLLRPVLMQKGALGAQRVVGLSSSAWHAIALGEDGHAYTGGRGKLSILGSDDDAVRTAFGGIDETGVLRGKEVVSVAAGGVHNLVLAVGTSFPKVVSVEAPADGFYNAGKVLSFRITFETSVSVSATPGGNAPSIGFTIGGVPHEAVCTSGMNTATLAFNYTVQHGDNGIVELASTAIELNDGVIQDVESNDIELDLHGIPEPTGDVIVDTVPPAVQPVSPAGEYTYRSPLDLGPVIVADEPVTAYGATGLPVGLTVDAATGAISGTPTQAGDFASTILATDRAGNTGAGTLSLWIAPVELTIDTGSLGLRVSDKTYDGTASASLITSTAKLLRSLPDGGFTDSLWGDDVTLDWSSAVAVFDNEIADGVVVRHGKDAGTHKPVAVTTPPVLTGRNATSLNGPNYILAPIPTLYGNILPRKVTVVADDKLRGFGFPNPPLTWSVVNVALPDEQTDAATGAPDYSAVLSGEPVLTTAATTKTPPGNYSIHLELGSLEPTGNYAFADPATLDGELTIEPAPIVTSILRHDPLSLTPTGDRVIWAVHFNLPVTGVDVGDFVLTATGTAAAGIVSVEPGATTDVWLVSADSLAGSGSLRLDVKSAGTEIKDATGYDLYGGFSSGQIYVLGGTMATFGRNNNGQLGTPVENTPWSSIPLMVVDNNSVLNDLTIAAVAAGQAHSLAIGSDGRVYGWGFNNYGQLGIGTIAPMTYAAPERVVGLDDRSIVAVAAGWAHSIALDAQGQVYTWGGNDAGQLGLGSTGNPSATPSLVTSLAGKTIIAIAAGHSHSLALAGDGTLYAWGRNDFGQLGVQQHDQVMRTLPTPVFAGSGGALYGRSVVAIAAGYRHSLALTADGTAYTWGDNTEGQLGSGGDFVSHTVPWPVFIAPGSALEDVSLVAIGSGCVAFHSVAISADGRCFTWGRNDHGQLGNGESGTGRRSNEPVPVTTLGVLAGEKLVSAAAGADFTVVHTGGLAAENGGAAYSWGRNEYGELGNGDTVASTMPVAVDRTSLLAHKEVIAVSAGADHTIALTADGPMIAIAPVTGDDMLNRDETLGAGFSISGSTTYVESGRSVTIRIIGETSPLLFTPVGAVQVTELQSWTTAVQRNVPGLIDGTYKVTADVTDALGSAAPRAQREFIVDTISPTLLSLGRGAPLESPTNADELTFRAVFSEPVTSVDPDDWAVQGSTARVSAITEVPDDAGESDGCTYDITITASAENDLASLPSGTVVLALKSAADGQSITDLAGNPVAESALTSDYELDNVPPTVVSIDRTSPLVSPTSADALTFRVTFSEPVAVRGEDFAMSGTTAHVTLIQAVGGSAYDVTFADGDLAGLDGTVELGFASGHQIADLVGNPLTDTSVPEGNADVRTCLLDNTRPAVAIGTPSEALTAAGPVSFVVTYTDVDFDVCTLTDADVVVHATGTAGVGSVVVSGTGNTREVTLAGITGDGDIAISIVAGTARDHWGNLAPESATSEAFAADNSPPSVTISRLTSSVTTTGPVLYEVKYDDPHFGTSAMDADDVLLVLSPGVSVGSISVSGAGAVWEVELSGILGDGTLQIGVASGTAVDAVGNLSVAATSADTVTVANNSPTLTSIERLTPGDEITNADTLVFRATFSTEVTLAPTDFAVGGTTAAVTRITPAGGGAYEVEISGGDLTDYEGRVTIAISADHMIEDTSGRPLIATDPTGANDNSFELDNTPPAVSIGPPSPATTTTEDVSFEVAYADEHLVGGSIVLAPEQVSLVTTGTANGEIVVNENGTEGRLVTITNVTGDGTLSIMLAAGTATDAAGNPAPEAGPSEPVVVGGGAPQVVAILRSSPETFSTNADSVTFRVRFSEPVSQPVTGDFVIGFSPAGPTASIEVIGVEDEEGLPDAAAWDVTLSGEALVDLNDVTVSLELSAAQTIADLSGNPLAGLVPPADSNDNTYRFDNTAPVVGIDPIDGAVDDLIDGGMIGVGLDITGSGDAPDRPVTIYFEPAGGGVAVYSQTVAPPWPSADRWRVVVPAGALEPVADGSYRVSVELVDEAGNAATAWRDPVVIDRTAPLVGINPICGDNLAGTADLEAGFSVTGTSSYLLPGETIVLAIGGLTKTTHPDAAGNWVVVIPGTEALAMLADGGFVEGDNWVTADATDSAGHPAPRAEVNLVVQTQAPTLSIDPVAGVDEDLIGAEDIAAGFEITGSSNADGRPFIVYLDPAASGPEPPSHLFRLGGEHCQWTAPGRWSATFDAGVLDLVDGTGALVFPDGEYRVSVEIADAAGNIARSNRLFRIDRTLPQVAIHPISGGTVNPTEIAEGFVIAGTTLNVEPGRTVTIGIAAAGGAPFFESADGQVTVAGPEGTPAGSWQLEAAVVAGLAGEFAADGEYLITASVSDAAGTVATVSYSLFVDHTAPVLRILPEPPALIVIDAAALEAEFPITGTCSEPGGDVVVTLARAAAPDVTLYTVPGGTTWTLPDRWSVSIPVGALLDAIAYPDGDYVVAATFVDDSGNVAIATHALRLDRLPPEIAIDAISGGFVGADEAAGGFEITGVTENVETGCRVTVAIANPQGVQFYTSAEGLVTVSTPDGSSSGTWRLDADEVQGLAVNLIDEGDYTVTAIVTDLSGATASAVRTFTFDRTAPTILILPEPPAGIFIDGAAIASGFEIRGTGSEFGRVVVVTFARQDTPEIPVYTVEGVTIWSGEDQWRVTVPAGALSDPAVFPDDRYVITAALTDAAGQVSRAEHDLIVDRAPPQIAIASISGGDVNEMEVLAGFAIEGTTENVESDRSVTVTITDAEGPSIYESDAGAVLVAAEVGSSAGTWLLPADVIRALSGSLVDGDYTITAVTSDAFGTVVSASCTLKVDRTAPTIAIGPVSGDDMLNAAEAGIGLPIWGTTNAEAGCVVTVSFDFLEYTGTVLATEAGPDLRVWEIDPIIPKEHLATLANGIYVVSAFVADAAGNPTPVNAERSLEVDKAAPGLTIDPITANLDNVLSADEFSTLNPDETTALRISGRASNIQGGRLVTVTFNGLSYQTAVIEDEPAPAIGEPLLGSWQIDIPWSAFYTDPASLARLPDGRYAITADATDAAGEKARQATDTLTIDTFAPSLGIDVIDVDDAVNRADYVTGTELIVSGSAIGVEPGRSIVLTVLNSAREPVYSNSTALAVWDPINATIIWSLSIPHADFLDPATDGEYIVRVEATTESGRDAEPCERGFIVDREPVNVANQAITGVYGQPIGSLLQYVDDSPGEPDPTFQVLSGSLPDGVTLASDSGVVSGVPRQVGLFSAEVEIADAVGNPATATLTVTVSPAELAVTADPKTKAYGEADPTLTYQVDGLKFEDTTESVLAGALQRQAGEAVGIYEIEQGTLAIAAGNANYTLTFAGDELAITAAELTVTADPKIKAFGDPEPALTYQVSGLKYEDSAAAVLTGALTRQPGEAVGDYPIEQGTVALVEANANYTLVYLGSNLTITAAELRVTADPKTKVYGEEDPALTYQVSGLKFDDSAEVVLTGVLTRQPGEAVGAHAIEQGSLAVAEGNANYTLTFVANELTITAAGLTVTADPQVKVYGETDPILTYQVTGLQRGDTAEAILTGALARQAGETVGAYPIDQGTLAFVAGEQNYTLAYVGAELTIAAAELTVAANPKTKTYGEADPALTYTVNGLKFDDTAESVLAGALQRQAGEAVGIYEIEQGTLAVAAGNANYTLTFAGNELTITGAELRIIADDRTKRYGESIGFLGTEFTTEGLVGTDTVTRVSLTSLGSVATATVGGGPYPIDVSAAEGTGLENYVVTYVEGELTVAPAVVSVTARNQTRPYGEANPVLSQRSDYLWDGFADWDTVGVVQGAIAAIHAESANRMAPAGSTHPILPDLSGLMADNYTFMAGEPAGQLTIEQRPLTLTLSGEKSYDGTRVPLNATAAITAGTLAEGEDIDFSFSETSDSRIGTYTGILAATVRWGGVETTGNYALSYAGEYRITPRLLTLTLGGAKPYDGTRSPLAASGAVSLGTLAQDEEVHYSFDETSSPDVGSYAGLLGATIWLGATETTGNYVITYDGSYAITPRPITVTLGGSKIYDGNQVAAGAMTSVTAGSLAEGETITCDIAQTSAAAVGPYSGLATAHLWRGADEVTANYAISYDGAYVILVRSLVVTLTGSKTYDGTTAITGAGASPAAGVLPETGDVIVYAFGHTGSPIAGSYPNGPALTIISLTNAGGDAAGNYSISYAGSYEIERRALTVTLGGSKHYDGTTMVSNAEVAPLPGVLAETGDTISYSFGPTSSANAGIYPNEPSLTLVAILDPEGDDVLASYDLTYEGSYTIEKALAIVTLTDLAHTYDGAPKSASASTEPAGLAVVFTYDGSAEAPIVPGVYSVAGVVNDLNYTGTAVGLMTIAVRTPVLAEPVDGIVTLEDTLSPQILLRRDDPFAQFLQITEIVNGSLFEEESGSLLEVGDIVALSADGTAAVAFSPAADLNTPRGDGFRFAVKGALDASGTASSLGSCTVAITVAEVPDAPVVPTGLVTPEDTLVGATKLIITRNTIDSASVTHFKITDVRGGELRIFRGIDPNTGTPLPVLVQDMFITADEAGNIPAGYGLKFMPAADRNRLTDPAPDAFSFRVRAATGATDGATLADPVTVAITVMEVNDAPLASTVVFGTVPTDRPAADSGGTLLAASSVGSGELPRPTGVRPGTISSFATSSGTVTAAAEPEAGLSVTVPLDSLTENATAGPQSAEDELLVQSLKVSRIKFNMDRVYSVTQVDSEHVRITLMPDVLSLEVNAENPENSDVAFQVGDDGDSFISGSVVEDPKNSSYRGVSLALGELPDGISITSAFTLEDTRSASGLVISTIDPAVIHYVVTDITGGSLFKNSAHGGGQLNVNDTVALAEGSAGLQFMPAANAFSPSTGFSITVQGVSESGPIEGSVATATIIVTPVNDQPVAYKPPEQGGLAITAEEDRAYVLSTDDFGFADPVDEPANHDLASVRITRLPPDTRGSLWLRDTAGIEPVFQDIPIPVMKIDAGDLLYVPYPANAHGNAYDSFDFQLQDDGGAENGGEDLSESATMSVHVLSVNDPPVGEDRTVTTSVPGVYVFGAGDFALSDPNDVPPNALHSVWITELPAKGQLTLASGGGTLPEVTLDDLENGRLTYTADSGASGTDSFKFRVQDDGGTAHGGIDMDTTDRVMTLSLAPGFHSADTSDGFGGPPDWKIDANEVGRVIQLYNSTSIVGGRARRTGAYHGDVSSEDGFAMGEGSLIGQPHSADTGDGFGGPPDGKIDANELGRVIQLYNSTSIVGGRARRTGAYHPDPTQEDGFGMGALE